MAKVSLTHIQLNDEVTDRLIPLEIFVTLEYIAAAAHHYDDFHLWGKTSYSADVDHRELNAPRYSRPVH